MGLQHFIQVEKQLRDTREYRLYHHANPKFSVEIKPVYGPEGRVEGGVIHRVQIPNSWTRDYHQYGKLLAQAETLFRESLDAGGPGRSRT